MFGAAPKLSHNGLPIQIQFCSFLPVQFIEVISRLACILFGHTLDLYLKDEAGSAKAIWLQVVLRHKSGKALTAVPRTVYLR